MTFSNLCLKIFSEFYREQVVKGRRRSRCLLQGPRTATWDKARSMWRLRVILISYFMYLLFFSLSPSSLPLSEPNMPSGRGSYLGYIRITCGTVCKKSASLTKWWSGMKSDLIGWLVGLTYLDDFVVHWEKSQIAKGVDGQSVVQKVETALRDSQYDCGDQMLYTINPDNRYKEIGAGADGRRASVKGLLVFRGGADAWQWGGVQAWSWKF